MTVRRADPDLLYEDFIPQGEFRYPVSLLRERFDLQESYDDLDRFVGGAFWMDNSLPFTIKHYRSSEPDIFTIYFQRMQVKEVPEIVDLIISYLDVPPDYKTWDRSLDPDL